MPAKRINNTGCVNFSVSPSIAFGNGISFGANLGVNVVFSPGLNFSYAEVGNYKIYGTGVSIGIGFSATLVSLNLNWGASGINLRDVRKFIKNR